MNKLYLNKNQNLKKKGLNNYLNSRQIYLDSDYIQSISPLPSYDSDLENFWTQTSN
jgi:hypothetical protein